jgi:hypothetical protein
MSDQNNTDGAPSVMYVSEGDAFYAPPGTKVTHVPRDRSAFEELFLKIHPGTPRMLFDRVVSDERYTSMEVEYACRVWIMTTNALGSVTK